MSLILAIEPERRQAAHLISIVRHVQGAELILADTTERALESIGNNVPDLILVPALLSPQDDAALATALRVIASAAHVQMLTIPTFATPKPKRKSGMLSAFRRKAATEEPLEGCDPKVFAEEIASYLERASEERAAAQLYEDDRDEPQPEPAPSAVLAEFEEPAADAPLEPAYAEPVYAEPVYTEPVYAEPAYAETASVETVQEPYAPQELVAEETRPDEHYAASNIDDAPIVGEVELEPAAAPEPEEAADVLVATPPVPAMAFDEDVPVAAAPESVEEVAAAAPAFEDFLADFERANLPVIEEVRAEQWMGDSGDPVQDDEDVEVFEDDADHVDIDLSIELDASVHIDEPAPALRRFEPVVPVERFEPLPLSAWLAWPRLDWTPPEKPVERHAANGDAHKAAAAEPIAEFVQVEFEEALEAEETARLEHFEPVVPVERFEPMPLAAWQAWPRLEGVAAEAYQEPIAPRKAVAKPEWVELMRSLREDIARRRAELAESGPVAPPTQKPQRPRPRPAETHTQAAKPTAPPPDTADLKKRPKRTRPIEDEWGLFDPEQCGFAALLDKLDEITVTPPSPQPRRTSR